jgi:hypothetical protein
LRAIKTQFTTGVRAPGRFSSPIGMIIAWASASLALVVRMPSDLL